MTTYANSTRIRHDSDAHYQEWVQDFSDALDAIGLVQTSDTGQVTIGSLTRPGTGVNNGYQIRRFADSLQASAPIFLRFDFGTGGGGSGSPQISIAVGTGTNGAGTLTQTGMSGTMTTSRRLNPGNVGGSITQSDIGRPSHYCHAEGFFGVSWKNTLTANTTFGLPGQFAICRTCDNDGVPDGRGCMLDWGGNATTRQAVRFTAAAEAYTARGSSPDNNLGMFPQAPGNTITNGQSQVALGWTITPLAEPLFGLCGVYPDEIPGGMTFKAALVGTTPRTFFSVEGWAFGNPTGARVAMLWE